MTDLLKSLSDNQLAVLGCLGAIGSSVLLLAISYHSQPREDSRPAEQAPDSKVAEQERRRAA